MAHSLVREFKTHDHAWTNRGYTSHFATNRFFLSGAYERRPPSPAARAGVGELGQELGAALRALLSGPRTRGTFDTRLDTENQDTLLTWAGQS